MSIYLVFIFSLIAIGAGFAIINFWVEANPVKVTFRNKISTLILGFILIYVGCGYLAASIYEMF